MDDFKNVFAVFVIVFVILIVYSLYSSVVAPKHPLTKEQQAAIEKQNKEKTNAEMLCMEAVRAYAKFPSSVDFDMFVGHQLNRMQGGGWVVQRSFESKNGFGNLIPQMARCEVKNGKLQDFSVSNR